MTLLQSRQDNESLLKFMEQATMRVGGIDLLYDRSPDFNHLLQCQGKSFLTFLNRDKEKLRGCFSISFSDRWIHGEKKACGYIGDFRTNQSRRASVIWRKSYAPILQALQNEKSLGPPAYFLTAILKKNKEALRNLVESKKDLGFRYDFLQEVDMVNVFGFLPWKKEPPLQVVSAKDEDLLPLKNFLNQQEKKKLFGAIFDDSIGNMWDFRQKSWPHFSIDKFLLIKNASGEIQACTLPWDPSVSKRMKVVRAPSIQRFFFKLANVLGFNLPQAGESLRVVYMTHLNIQESLQKEDVIFSFLQWILKRNKSVHMVSFADATGAAKSLRSCLRQRIPVHLYAVSLSGSARISSSSLVGFEMGLV